MKNTSFLKRCLAMALALVLIASSANLGVALKAFAAEEITVSNGEIIANNYDLTDAEKDLLKSGYLAGGSYSYTVPTDDDNLVSVDTDNAKITAKNFGEWIPTNATILYGGKELNVALTNGIGSYDADVVGNAFSVKVHYGLDTQVDAAEQASLLDAGYLLKDGIATLDSVAALESYFAILETAVPTLVDIRDNGYPLMNGTSYLKDEETIAAITFLEKQTKSNSNGHLTLANMISAYTNGSKTQYLMTEAKAMPAEIEAILPHLVKLNSYANGFINIGLMGSLSQSMQTALNALANSCAKLHTGLSAVNNEESWIAANSTGLLSSGVNYAKLDLLVAALGKQSSYSVRNPLHVADADVQVKLSMFDVTVNVILNTVNENNEVVKYGEKSTVLTLPEGTAKAEILSEVEADGVVAKAITEWGTAYVDGQYKASYSQLPAELTADITYTVTYNPNQYTVTLWDQTQEQHPYGYQLTLPVHEDVEQSYDYKVNDVAFAQGAVITIEADTLIVRTSGKAYATTDLYTLVSNLYGDDIAKAILQSGAVKGNEAINYRKPDPTDAASLLKLLDGTLTASDYDAAYNGLSWNPYTYGEAGTENIFSGNTVSWSGDSAKVQYILNLTNYSKDDVAKVLALAETLKAEADEQKKTLDKLAENYGVMGQLDRTKLGALKGAIESTDLTPGDEDLNDAKNLELQQYFMGVVDSIIKNNVDNNNYLKIYNMLGQYNTNGLRYYYNNSAAVIAEINSLSGYLDALLADEEKEAVLGILVTAAGFPEYAGKITNLQGQMAAVKASLTAPNAAIDLTSDKLGALITGLTMEGAVKNDEADIPYLTSEMLTALDQSSTMVQIIIETPKGNATVTSDSMKKGASWTAAANEKLLAAKEQAVADLLGDDKAFYAEAVTGTLPAVDAVIRANVNVYYTYTEKTYTVKIDGEDDQSISLSDLEINLPKHATKGWSYTYTVDGAETIADTYTFTKAQVAALFTNGTYTITRVEHNDDEEKFEDAFDSWLVKNEQNKIVGLNPQVVGNAAGLEDFAMTLVNSGYSYIGLNGETLMGLNNNTLEISLQTLINAILNDEKFTSDMLIQLGENGKGDVLNAQIQLGNTADDVIYDLPFTLTLTSVPSQMATVSKGLKTAAAYVTFNSDNGKLAVHANLPDKVYGAYAAALIATGNVEKENVNELSQMVAMQFLVDYLKAVIESGMDIETFQNTLEMVGVGTKLPTQYNGTYNKAINAYDKKYITIDADQSGAVVNISVPGKTSIDALLKYTKVDTDKYATYLGMIKEYKSETATIEATATADLKNTDKTYYALIADVQASGMINKFDAPSTVNALASKVNGLAGYSAVILLDDVKGDLNFAGTTILDLNGKKIDGNVSGTNLFIVDSSMDTYNCGAIAGSVSGKVSIFGGNYNADVSAYLKEGYYKDGSTVRNALYYITKSEDTITFVLNADVYNSEYVTGYVPNVRALAIDIAADLVLNYMSTASLSVEGKELIAVNAEDLVGLYAGDTVNGLIKQAIDWVTVGEAGYDKNEGFEALVNMLIEDLLDFNAITEALNNGDALVTHEVTVKPWLIEIDHVEDGDYATVNVTSNDALAKTSKVAVIVESKHTAKVAEITAELAKIVVADETNAMVDIPQPTYSDKTLNVAVNGKANVVLDMSGDYGYAVTVGVILANNGAAQSSQIVAAINASDWNALEAAINESTVQELISALKALNRNQNFAAIISKLNITADLAAADALETKFHLILCGIGKACEVAGINGMNVKLSNYLVDGYYTLDKENVSRDIELSARGYSAMFDLTADEVVLKVKLFNDEPDCLWGDADHDGDVDNHDASLVFEYFMADEGEKPEICLIRTDVDGDGEITNHDASLIFECFMSEDPDAYEFPAEKA